MKGIFFLLSFFSFFSRRRRHRWSRKDEPARANQRQREKMKLNSDGLSWRSAVKDSPAAAQRIAHTAYSTAPTLVLVLVPLELVR